MYDKQVLVLSVMTLPLLRLITLAHLTTTTVIAMMMMRRTCFLHQILLVSLAVTSTSFTFDTRVNVHFISTNLMMRTQSLSAHLIMRATPQRLDENVFGILYVNDRCINCAACSNFAPTIFERGTKNAYKHVVYKQPTIQNSRELEEARAALAACPVAAIRVENKVQGETEAELKRALSIRPINGEAVATFPRPIVSEIDIGAYYLGHHNDASFGAIPYLVCGMSPDGRDISVMVDVPRFSPSSVRAVKSLSPSGPDYLFLTHVDDTADHNKWSNEFPNMQRIFHSGDLGRHNWIGDKTLEKVEILLRGKVDDDVEELMSWDINGNRRDKIRPMNRGEFVILHTPGHSPGSISLLFRPKLDLVRIHGILFTGDTYSWTTRDDGHMSGFPRYGNNLNQQAKTLQRLGSLSRMWDIVAPGHGHLRSYLKFNEEDAPVIKAEDMRIAVSELLSY